MSDIFETIGTILDNLGIKYLVPKDKSAYYVKIGLENQLTFEYAIYILEVNDKAFLTFAIPTLSKLQSDQLDSVEKYIANEKVVFGNLRLTDDNTLAYFYTVSLNREGQTLTKQEFSDYHSYIIFFYQYVTEQLKKKLGNISQWEA